MHWLLAALALFNLISMITVFTPRAVPRRAIPWVLFFTALLATELAWIWLPLQMILAGLLSAAGGTQHWIGQVSLWLLFLTWAGLVWGIWQSTRAREVLERALQAGLGQDYRQQIPAAASDRLRTEVRFADWRQPLPKPGADIEVLRDIPYGPAGIRQQLDIYRPRELPEEGAPVLLQIHGGAWTIGDKGNQALPLMHHLASRGWICVAANYRLSPSVGFPTHLEDCKAALCWIREEGHKYGMDTGFVAVTGGSAGGHLCALMGLTGNRPELQPTSPNTDTSVQACIPFYGVYDFLVRYDQHPNRHLIQKFLTGRVMHSSPEDSPELWELASPIAQVHPDLPPFMVIHGDHDSLAAVAEGRLFSERLREVSRSPVVYAELPGTEHAFEILHSLRTEHTVDAVHRFLEWARARDSQAATTEGQASTDRDRVVAAPA